MDKKTLITYVVIIGGCLSFFATLLYIYSFDSFMKDINRRLKNITKKKKSK